MSAGLPPPPSPPHLDPPFRGYIETTYDSLLVFEAARRGMIPRVTRRLIERERGMVQSGAVFVFDEQESGIRRWTDGLVWSPSRILGNFLVSGVSLLPQSAAHQGESLVRCHDQSHSYNLGRYFSCAPLQATCQAFPFVSSFQCSFSITE